MQDRDSTEKRRPARFPIGIDVIACDRQQLAHRNGDEQPAPKPPFRSKDLYQGRLSRNQKSADGAIHELIEIDNGQPLVVPGQPLRRLGMSSKNLCENACDD